MGAIITARRPHLCRSSGSTWSSFSQSLERQRLIAVTLQENFIHPLPKLEGLELSVVSKAASHPELVGGDFSDVFLLDDGSVAILIGDVAGKGIRAAGLTETVRSTVRAFAAVDPSPAFVLQMTNQLLLRREVGEELVTALLVMLDRLSGRALVASAAHPPVVHLSTSTCLLFCSATNDSSRWCPGCVGPPRGTCRKGSATPPRPSAAV